MVKKLNYDILHDLLDIEGVSGNEVEVRKYIQKKIKPYVDVIRTDRLGDLICHKKGKKPCLMLAAHMDEIGLMVKNIDKNGKIFVSPLGGINTLNMIGQSVEILNSKKSIFGIISTKEINNDYDIEELPTINDLFVDTGLSAAELKKRGVDIGNYIALERLNHDVGNPDFLTGKALDDRIGCYALIEVAKRLKSTKNEVYFVFTVQEEVGLYGAKVSTYQIDPDMAVAVDVSNANDTNDEPTKCLGSGPVLTMKDDEMIGNACLNNYFKQLGKKMKIPIQLEVSNFGTTDALTISLSKGGVPTTSLGVAIRNIHTTHGLGSKKDIAQCIDLLEAFTRNPPAHCIDGK